MATWTDDFNRANGPILNGWTNVWHNTQILNQRATGNADGNCVHANPVSTGNIRLDAHMFLNGAYTSCPLVWIKANAGGTQFYAASVSVTATVASYTLIKYNSPTYTYPIVGQIQGGFTTTPVVSISYVDGWLRLYVDGTFCGACYDTALAANTGIGMQLPDNVKAIDELTVTDIVSPSLTIIPPEVYNPGDPVTLELTGGGQPWTPGVPGSPVFTVDRGSLSGQEITSGTTATATYTPPTLGETDAVHDPLNGVIGYITLTTDLLAGGGGGGGGAGQFTEQAVADLTAMAALAADHVGGTGLDLFTFLLDWFRLWAPGGGQPDEALTDLLNTISTQVALIGAEVTQDLSDPDSLRHLVLDARAAAQNAETAAESAQSSAEAANAGILYATSTGTVSIASARDDIRGLGAPSIYDARQDIATLRDGNLYTLSSILGWLNDIRTVHQWTLDTLYDRFTELKGTSDVDMTELLTAIGAIPPTDLTAVLNAIAAVRGAGNPDLAYIVSLLSSLSSALGSDTDTILSAIAGVRGVSTRDLTEVYNAVIGLRGSGNRDISDVYNRFDTLDINVLVPPVWPGAGNVTWGTPVTIDGNTTVPGPMHGVRLVITNLVKGNIPTMPLGDTTTHRNLGRYAWTDDAGYQTQWAGIPSIKAILTPANLLQASNFVVNCYQQVTGTVTPWTITS